MTATDAQVRILMRERRRGKTQEQAAAKANLRSRKTVSRYEKMGKMPSELKQPRTYGTHADVFEEDSLSGYARRNQASIGRASCGPFSGESSAGGG